MKTRYITTLLLSFVVAGVSAQNNKNNDLQRSVTIEKEFTPIVQDASKINTIPEMEVSASQQPDIKYSEWNTPYTENPVITPFAAGDNGVEAPDRRRGYVRAEMGNYLNLNAEAGIRIVDKERDRLSLWYRHNSTNSTLSYMQDDDKTRQRRNDNRLNLQYSHRFKNLDWHTAAHYRYNGFNYYGLPLYMDKSAAIGLSAITDQQTVQQYGIETRIASKPGGEINYSAEIAYHGYNSDLGLFYDERGAIENHLTTRFDISTPINKRYTLGVALGMDNLIYNRSHIDNYTVIQLNPYFDIARKRLHFRVGVSADISFNDNTIFRIAPDVHFEWEMKKFGYLYTTLTGGKSLNTLAHMSKLTDYIDPSSKMSNTYTPADLTVGLRTNTFKHLHLTLYGGIKYSIDALFDYRTQIIEADAMTTRLTRPVVSFYAADAYAWKAGFEVRYTLRDFLKASLAWEHNEWRDVDDCTRIRSSLPRNEWRAAVTVLPVKQLDITADFYMADGLGYDNRVQGHVETNLKGNLPNIVNLNLSGIYRLNKHVHFSARFNNLLSKRTELFYGMPSQRFHFLLGAGVVF